MKTCLIKNEISNLELGYLFYYEKKDIFVIELKEDLKEVDVPIFFMPFINKKETTIDIKWSRQFVESRIIPRERQNINSIIKNNKLKNYDVFEMLLLAKGRCSQDDLTISIVNGELPSWLISRLENNIKTLTHYNNHQYLLEVGNHMIVVDVSKYLKDNRRLNNLINRYGTFKKIPGGCGIYDDEDHFIMLKDLLKVVVDHLDRADLYQKYFVTNVVDTSEASKMLGCSRQYINSLVNNNRLKVYKELNNTKLFRIDEIERILE